LITGYGLRRRKRLEEYRETWKDLIKERINPKVEKKKKKDENKKILLLS
jgi:hypothetical protein